MSDIPIKNLYYMILYAFNKVKNKSVIDSKSFERDYTSSDVLVELFLYEVSKIIKNGIYKNYLDIEEESVFIKGKMDVKRNAVTRSVKKHIIHDVFSPNLYENQIIKYTLNRLLFSNIKKEHHRKTKSLYALFGDVEYVDIDDSVYKSITYNKLNKNYQFALQLSIFINKKVIPNTTTGKLQFVDIMEDEETMSMIYEEFLRNFYSIHTDYKVKVKEYNWYLEPVRNSDSTWLPKMKTDIEINIDDNTKIIIDAKYYKEALKSRYEAMKFPSSNIYQMNTYLMHNLKYESLKGILLYPAVNYEIHQSYISEVGFGLEFHTINLNQEWTLIHNDLLTIIKNA